MALEKLKIDLDFRHILFLALLLAKVFCGFSLKA